MPEPILQFSQNTCQYLTLCLKLAYFINIEVAKASVLAYKALSIGAGGQSYRVFCLPLLPLLDLTVLEQHSIAQHRIKLEQNRAEKSRIE